MISRNSPNYNLIPFRLFIVICLVCPAAGCSMRANLSDWKNDDTASEFLINYTVKNAIPDLDPWSSFADRGMAPANWTIDAEPDRTSARSAALQIEYPHPDRGGEFALATLSVYNRPLNEEQFATQPKKHWYDRLLFNNYLPQHKNKQSVPAASEIVTMQIPRTQFELLVNEMNQAGYLDENHTSKRSFSTALLSVLKNQKAIHESSVEEPRLNEVIQNVYRNGKVIVGEKRHSAPSILQTSAFIEAPNPTVVN